MKAVLTVPPILEASPTSSWSRVSSRASGSRKAPVSKRQVNEPEEDQMGAELSEEAQQELLLLETQLALGKQKHRVKGPTAPKCGAMAWRM